MMSLLSLLRPHLIVALALSWSGLIDGCTSMVIQPRSWDYKGHHIGYEEARISELLSEPGSTESVPGDREKDHDPILLLNGFGVGSFHQHRLMPHLLLSSRNRVVYGMDYLGQGRSWPVDCDDGNSKNEEGLRYCADTWVEQIIDFIEIVILPQQHSGKSKKVHVVGNSVGGHLAVVLAARRPDLVESICLLNATPVWGLNLPFWSGHLPPPGIPKKVGRYLFDWIRDIQTIEKYLETAYANRKAFDRELIHQIRACTEGKGGHAAFASIMWSPPASLPAENKSNFYDMLSKLECDVLLMFGKSDPWCKPALAKRMLNALDRRKHPHNPAHRYLELENVGHCPNHEAPQAVGKVIRAWVNATNKRDKDNLTLIQGPEEEVVVEPWAEIKIREVDKPNINVSFMDRCMAMIVQGIF